MRSKYSKHSKSARKIEDRCNELSKYSKSPPEETVAERIKLMPRKRKRQKIGTGIKVLTPNKLLSRLSILLVQIKAGNNSNKLKNQIKQILYLLHLYNKITKQFNQIVVIMRDNKLILTTEPKTICLDLPEYAGINLKHEIDSIIKRNKLLADHTIKTILINYYPNIRMETTFMNRENSKTNEPHKFFLNLSQRLDIKSSYEHVALQNLSICYTWKNIRQLKNNKLKIIAPTRNNKFESPDFSYSVTDIQDYIEHIIKKHETFPTNPPIHIYINRINNRLVLKIKDRYKLKLQTPETMKLFSSTKN